MRVASCYNEHIGWDWLLVEEELEEEEEEERGDENVQ